MRYQQEGRAFLRVGAKEVGKVVVCDDNGVLPLSAVLQVVMVVMGQRSEWCEVVMVVLGLVVAS